MQPQLIDDLSAVRSGIPFRQVIEAADLATLAGFNHRNYLVGRLMAVEIASVPCQTFAARSLASRYQSSTLETTS
jgi:hypothetical protein